MFVVRCLNSVLVNISDCKSLFFFITRILRNGLHLHWAYFQRQPTTFWALHFQRIQLNNACSIRLRPCSLPPTNRNTLLWNTIHNWSFAFDKKLLKVKDERLIQHLTIITTTIRITMVTSPPTMPNNSRFESLYELPNPFEGSAKCFYQKKMNSISLWSSWKIPYKCSPSSDLHFGFSSSVVWEHNWNTLLSSLHLFKAFSSSLLSPFMHFAEQCLTIHSWGHRDDFPVVLQR